MPELPRLAIGTVQPNADATAMLWALMDALERAGLRVQSFLSHAYFCPRDGATAITGLSPRHLDSWIMTEAVCREIFARGAGARDLAIVEGRFEATPAVGGDLNTLCSWLQLPRLAVVDVRLLRACCLPPRPNNVDGLLLDRVESTSEMIQVRTAIEALWNIPVVGSLGSLARAREAIAALPSGTQPDLELCHQLGDQFARSTNLSAIFCLAHRPWAMREPPRGHCDDGPPLRVAVAYDEAFRGYFPDTLDLLESRGAVVEEFSPLSDERLPHLCDVVYFGCGHPERFAAPLAENDCMMLALKSHLCSGRRIYAECGGLAYLCQHLQTPDGRRWPMVGAFPLTACYQDSAAPPTPIEMTLRNDSWLGAAGARMRGYVNPRWTYLPDRSLNPSVEADSDPTDLVVRHQALGSRAYLNFAAQPQLFEGFFRPHVLSPEAAAARISHGA